MHNGGGDVLSFCRQLVVTDNNTVCIQNSEATDYSIKLMCMGKIFKGLHVVWDMKHIISYQWHWVEQVSRSWHPWLTHDICTFLHQPDGQRIAHEIWGGYRSVAMIWMLLGSKRSNQDCSFRQLKHTVEGAPWCHLGLKCVFCLCVCVCVCACVCAWVWVWVCVYYEGETIVWKGHTHTHSDTHVYTHTVLILTMPMRLYIHMLHKSFLRYTTSIMYSELYTLFVCVVHCVWLYVCVYVYMTVQCVYMPNCILCLMCGILSPLKHLNHCGVTSSHLSLYIHENCMFLKSDNWTNCSWSFVSKNNSLLKG